MRAWLAVMLLACGNDDDPPAPPPPAPTPMFLVGDLASDLQDACAAPMLADLLGRPHWSLRVDERHWSDVDDGIPDELAASITVDARGAEWVDPAYQERLELSPKQVLDALGLSCHRPDDAPGALGGRRYELAYGAASPAMVLIDEWSPAGQALRAVMDPARARYIASRVADARAATLVLRGEQYDGERWTHVTVTARSGTLSIDPDNSGAAIGDPDMVQVPSTGPRTCRRPTPATTACCSGRSTRTTSVRTSTTSVTR